MLLGATTFAMWAGVASADMITFNLDTGNSAISGFTGPYAKVTVNRTSTTTADIIYQSLTNSGNIYLLGDGGSVDANINGAFTVGTITGSNAGTGFTPGPYSNSGSGNVDGFGVFNLTVTSFDGFTHSSDFIDVPVTLTSGTWASASDVLTINDFTHNAVAAAHIFVTSAPADASNGAIVTGFAAGSNGGGPPTSIPEPGSLSLLAAVLLGVGALTRRRRS